MFCSGSAIDSGFSTCITLTTLLQPTSQFGREWTIFGARHTKVLLVNKFTTPKFFGSHLSCVDRLPFWDDASTRHDHQKKKKKVISGLQHVRELKLKVSALAKIIPTTFLNVPYVTRLIY